MLSPKGLDKAQFYCRKGYPSLNVQPVCDSNRRLMNAMTVSFYNKVIMEIIRKWQDGISVTVAPHALLESKNSCAATLQCCTKEYSLHHRTSLRKFEAQRAILGSTSVCCRLTTDTGA